MRMVEFFKHFYQFCEGSLELRALPSRKQAFLALDNLEGIKNFCDANKKDHLYFGVATRDGQGGGKENIVEIPAVWCDADFKVTTREVLADRLRKFPFKPSIIIKSGGGVHLYWLLKEPATKSGVSQVEEANRRIAGQLGGDFNACDGARILRIPETVNHKYPANCEVAKCDDYFYQIGNFLQLLPEVPSEKKTDQKSEGNPSEWLKEAMGGVAAGERDATLTKIAGYWMNRLLPKEVLTILKSCNLNNEPPLPEKDLHRIVKSVARYEPEKPPNRVDVVHIYDAKRMLAEYRAHINALDKNRFITGIGEIDKRIRGVAGGEVLTIIARAGSFKTAMLQNLLKNYVQNSSWGAAFFSIEMPIASVAERYHEILNGLSGLEIEEFYRSTKEGADAHVHKLEEGFIEALKGLYAIPFRVNVSDISAYVSLIEKEFHTKIGVVGIDYLGLMDGPGINEYEINSRLARDIKAMAKTLNLPVIILGQASRKAGSGKVEVSLDHARGSGAIEEGADFVLGLWQVEKAQTQIERMTGAEAEHELICRILKNRKGSVMSTWRLELEPRTLKIGTAAEAHKPPKEKDRNVL